MEGKAKGEKGVRGEEVERERERRLREREREGREGTERCQAG